MSRFRRPNSLSNGEADGVGLKHAAGDFELAEQHGPGSDFPMKAVSVKSTVEMV